MNRVIVTGGNGFIGKSLVKRLVTYDGCRIIIISDKSELNKDYFSEFNKRRGVSVVFYAADIRDKDSIINIFQNEDADTCVHLAAKISVASSTKNPTETLDINVKGTLNVLEAAYKSNIKNFVFASSAAVYGNVNELPILENHNLQPLSNYGKSKLAAERHVLEYQKLNKIKNAVSLRFFNVYGKGQTNSMDVTTNFATQIASGLPPVIYGDGTQTRDFISVDDVAEAIILSIKQMEGLFGPNQTISTVFNVGTGIPTSINELAQKMNSIFGTDLKPTYVKDKDNLAGILNSYADTKKSEKILKFVAKKTLEEGLQEIIESVKPNSKH